MSFMVFPSCNLFCQIFQWNLLVIVLAAVFCMTAISVWLFRNQYRLPHLLGIWCFFLMILIVGSWRAYHEERVFHETWKNMLLGMTRSFAAATETMGHAKISPETSPNDPVYRQILNLHAEWCRDIPIVAYIYTLRRRNDKTNAVYWIVSCESDINRDNKIEGHTEVGENLYQPYNEWFEIYQKGFDGNITLDENVTSTQYGTTFVTAVAPLRDPENPEYVEAILGVDFRVDKWDQMVGQIRLTTSQSLILLLVLYLISIYLIAILQRAVSRLTETNRELVTAKKAADAATRAKNDFLANMSHEIRTPMNALVGFTDILMQRFVQNCEPQERENSEGILEIIRKSSRDLLTIINDILDFSRIEANLLQIESVPLSIKQVIEDIWQMEKSNITEKHLNFSVKYKEPIPELILGDPTRLRQILIYLIDNAIKFTEKGKIEVHCETFLPSDSASSPTLSKTTTDWQQSYPESMILQISVIDTGIGISPEQMRHLFQPFTQVDNSSTRKFGGTGLGLSISKRLAQLMDGNIAVKSELNVGSVFTLTLHVYLPSKHESNVFREKQQSEESRVNLFPQPDLEVAQPVKTVAPEQEPPQDRPLKNARILLVEDMVINQVVISTQLRNAGAKVEIAGNGELGIQKVTQDIDNGLFFDIILMDMQMPVMDGYDATALLRSQGYNRPIIAITAHALTGDREKTIEAGCDDYISKPVDRKILIETVKKYLNQK
ncbi:MAG: response regulator [Planctomycetaceae bacterium]|jgi:signal transduction histidine kinase/CheY-like chemotaxis protein|nr:response regulator [Planctomycetaceae bacterium]